MWFRGRTVELSHPESARPRLGGNLVSRKRTELRFDKNNYF